MGEVASDPNRAWLTKRSDIVAAWESDASDFSQYMLPQNKPRSAILSREVDFLHRAGFEEARHILCTSFTCMPRRCCQSTCVGAAPLSKEVQKFRSRRPLPVLLDPALILPLPSHPTTLCLSGIRQPKTIGLN